MSPVTLLIPHCHHHDYPILICISNKFKLFSASFDPGTMLRTFLISAVSYLAMSHFTGKEVEAENGENVFPSHTHNK